jgi:MFS family permease
MVVGILAWPIRYAIFALGAHFGPGWLPLVEASLTFHGLCYVFFFVVGFIYVDQVAPPDIRASAQSLIGVITLGIGLYLGSILAGQIKDLFTHGLGAGQVTDWTAVFLVPCALTVLCAIVFPMVFKAGRGADLESPSQTLIHGPGDR